jgi:hypothetical protein
MQSYRFVFIRRRVARQRKGPVQLDLLVPQKVGFEFKVVITNPSPKSQRGDQLPVACASGSDKQRVAAHA